MLLTIATAVAITCATPMFFNDTNFKFNEHDKKMYDMNSKRCGAGRYSDTPCVKYFKKVGERDYHLVCTNNTRR